MRGGEGGKNGGGKKEGRGLQMDDENEDQDEEGDDEDDDRVKVPKGNGGPLRSLQKKMVMMLVFLSFVIILIASIGICLAKSPPQSKCFLIVYGSITLLLGFFPMVIQGGSLLAMSRTSPERVQELCNLDP